MSSDVTISGLDDLVAAIEAEVARIETGTETAIAEAVEGTYDDSQAAVPYDSVRKHPEGYVHLKDSGEKEVEGLEGSVSYGTDHPWYVEFGTSRMPAQPYLQPAFESNAAKLVKRCEDLLP